MKHYILLAVELCFLAFLASCEPQVPVTPEEDIDLSSLPYGLSGYSLTDNSTPKADEPCVIYYKAGGGFPFSGYTDVLYAHIGIVEFECNRMGENARNCAQEKFNRNEIYKAIIKIILEY